MTMAMALHKGQKVLAFPPPTGEERIGFVLNPEPNDEGYVGVQVGSDVYALKEDEGGGGETFRPFK